MDENPHRDDAKQRVRLLTRAFAVLFAFTPERPTRTLDDLSHELDINKPSLLRIIRSLEQEGLLLRADLEYRLGPRVLDLSNVYLSSLSLLDVARPHMRELARTTKKTVSLGIRDGLEVVYVAVEQIVAFEVGIQSQVGGRHPVHATALGKVLLAALDQPELVTMLEERPLQRLTHRTIVSPNELVRHVHIVRNRGYATDDEERGIGIRCAAAPIRDHDGMVIAAVSVAGPIFHMTNLELPRCIEATRRAAAAISHGLGHVSIGEPESASDHL